jgi:hypothetical protein
MARWRRLLWAALAASAISCVATVQPEEDNESERTVSIDRIPAAARDAIRKHVGSGRLMQVHMETGPNGKPVYKARISHVGTILTIRVDAAGHLLSSRRGN